MCLFKFSSCRMLDRLSCKSRWACSHHSPPQGLFFLLLYTLFCFPALGKGMNGSQPLSLSLAPHLLVRWHPLGSPLDHDHCRLSNFYLNQKDFTFSGLWGWLLFQLSLWLSSKSTSGPKEAGGPPESPFPSAGLVGKRSVVLVLQWLVCLSLMYLSEV